jgi:hypothetical protein
MNWVGYKAESCSWEAYQPLRVSILKEEDVWTRLKGELGSKKEKELFFSWEYVLEMAHVGSFRYLLTAYLLHGPNFFPIISSLILP